jgi:hypothetical protein
VVAVHAFLALLLGFAVIVALMAALTALFARLTPEWMRVERNPRPGYVFANLGSSFLAAAAGGYATTWIAQNNPLGNPLYLALALAIVVLAMGALSALQSRGKQPKWYLLALVAFTPAGVLAGALVRMRVLGIL